MTVKMSLRRIAAVLMRYLYLHKRSLPRFLELIFWPVMDLLVWGFVTVYIQKVAQDDLSRIVVFLINALIFWDILYRSQQGVTISFMEEIWHQNMINMLVSPLRLWEWLTATYLYGMLKTVVITCILAVIAAFLYHFHLIDSLGFALLPLVANLLLFGWTLGTFTSALLIRWGYSAEALVWGIPFLFQPISAVFYPLSVLPLWMKPLALSLPSTYVFEGMRFALNTGTIPWQHTLTALGLNLFYFLLGTLFFQKMFQAARESGRLVRLGMD